jgi:LmbE family N-acetylglucosaminyl deacetylase
VLPNRFDGLPNSPEIQRRPALRPSGALRLMAVLAHPDDESLAIGGTLARYAAEGVETYVVCATRGERGWRGAPDLYPGPDALGRIRERELRAAAAVLGATRVNFLDYIDGELDDAHPDEVIEKIVALLREVRPQVVVTFGPDGIYGHPDHIAISQLTTAAVMAAADPEYLRRTGRPHRAAKLYYSAFRQAEIDIYTAAFGAISMEVDSQLRGDVAWPDWAITTHVDAAAYAQQVARAIACHESQLADLRLLQELPPALHERLWGSQTFYRALSFVNGGRAVEGDLFAGLR